MQHKSTVIGILLIGWLCLATAAFGQTATARFLLFRPSAESMAMGGTGVATARTPFATYFNPAGLAFTNSVSIGGSYVRPVPIFSNIEHSYVVGAFPISGVGAFAVSANLYWPGTQVRQGTYALLEHPVAYEIKTSYARHISEHVGLGVTAGILRLKMETEDAMKVEFGRATSFVLDGGVLFHSLLPEATIIAQEDSTANPFATVCDHTDPPGVCVGVSVTNIGGKVTMIDPAQSDPLPTTLLIGASYSVLQSVPVSARLAVDIENQLPEGSLVDFVRWGCEVRVYSVLALRGGYVMDSSGPATSYWTFGGGLTFRFLHLNVARYTRALEASWHVDGRIVWEVL